MSTENLPKIISFQSIHPFNGKTITINEKENLSIFDIKRFYWINYHTPETTFSEHAHKSLQQIIITIEGNVNIYLESVDGISYQFNLNNPSQGLFIPPMFWKKIVYINPCNLLCLASDTYDEKDYIRSYEEFKQFQK
jgi:hypothetical protein